MALGIKECNMAIYAGLHKVSCDMCGGFREPQKVIQHKDGSSADICDICYGKCLVYPKFQQGIKDKDIMVKDY